MVMEPEMQEERLAQKKNSPFASLDIVISGES